MPSSPNAAFTITFPARSRLRRLAALAALALMACLPAAAQEPRPAVELLETAPAPAPTPEPLPPPDPEAAPGVVVGDIQFKGLLSWEPETLIVRLKTKIGEPYNALLIREDVTRLAEIMRQAAVGTEPMPDGQVRVIFNLVEFPRLRNMQVIGNDKITNERIDKIAKLKAGDILEERALKSLRNALLDEYRKMGLSRAEVTMNLAPVLPAEPPAPGAQLQFEQVDLQIIIDEGEKIIVDDVIIEGNDVFSKVRLRFLMKTKGSWGFVKNYYDDRMFEDDLALMKEYYNQHGYFDAAVERGAFEERRDGAKIRVSPVVQIVEGSKYTIGRIDVRGERLFSRQEVLEPFEGLQGKEFSAEGFNKAMETAKNLYLDSGFLTTEIKPINKFDPATMIVDVTIQVNEQNRIYVGDINVQRPTYETDESPGVFRRFYDRIAPPIKDEAIIREVLLEPGEVYSKAQERESVRKLEELGIFTDIQGRPTANIVNVPTANPRVHDALVTLEEGPSGNYGGGIGFGDQQGAFVYAYLNERNLFGQARDFRATVSVGTSANNASVTYLDRHFLGTNDALGVSLFYAEYSRDGYIETSAGTTAELTRRLYGGWTGAVRGKLAWVDIKERAGINAEEDIEGSYAVATARLALASDTRAPLRAPTQGRWLNGAVELGYAGGPLLKFTGDAEYNFRLTERMTYRLSPSFGLIPYDRDAVGLSERLFLGGADDLRGFRYRGAGLRDDDEEEVGLGGSVKALVRNELLFPIFDPVSGVYFIDAGVLGASPFSYEFPRASTGLGVRLAIQQATIAIDFALPFLSGADDQTQFVHFSFKSRI